MSKNKYPGFDHSGTLKHYAWWFHVESRLLAWGPLRCFCAMEVKSTNIFNYASKSLWASITRRQNISTHGIKTIGVIANAFTLLWGNLCRNNCIRSLTSLELKKEDFKIDATITIGNTKSSVLKFFKRVLMRLLNY